MRSDYANRIEYHQMPEIKKSSQRGKHSEIGAIELQSDYDHSQNSVSPSEYPQIASQDSRISSIPDIKVALTSKRNKANISYQAVTSFPSINQEQGQNREGAGGRK